MDGAHDGRLTHDIQYMLMFVLMTFTLSLTLKMFIRLILLVIVCTCDLCRLFCVWPQSPKVTLCG